MVTIEELSSNILRDAQAQAGQIDEETRAEVERINAETRRLVEQQRAKLQQQAKQQMLEIAARLEAKRELVARQAMLQAKQELLENTFKAAAEQLYSLKGAKRNALIKRLLQDASKQIAIGSIISAKKDARSIKGTKVIVDGKGGFIAKSKDGKVQIDMRFETLLEDVKARKAAEVAAVLFKEPAKTAPSRPKAQKAKKAAPKKAMKIKRRS